MKNVTFVVLAGMVGLIFVGPAISQSESDINAKVAQLDIDTATLDDVIRIFGEPAKYYWGRETFAKDNLPRIYIAQYPNEFSVVMDSGHVDELRFESPAAGYLFREKIRVGSSLYEVLKVIGQPKETVVGQPNKFEDGILYKDIDRRKGYCYYGRKDKNVRFFFADYKVTGLYVTSNRFGADTGGSSKRKTLLSIPKYNPKITDEQFQVDLRSYDLSKLDLKDALGDLLHASFDDKTVWPPPERMPKAFKWKQFMELGRNPGLGVRSLHKRGITGRGIGIAIIDQPLLTTHQEYADRIKLYEKINPMGSSSTMHGAAVASIAVGKTVGVAPEADLYYISSRTGDRRAGGKEFTWNFSYYAQAINRILEINKNLPKDKKIRVIAMQVGWGPGQAGYEEITKAVEKAKSGGMLVISSCIDDVHGFKFHGLGRHPLANPDDFKSYEPGLWWAEAFYNGIRWRDSDRLLVPMDSRTTANFTSSDGYVFYREGGWSWSIPYIAGVYALVAQVDPEITPKRFWLRALKTGRTIRLKHDGETFPFGRIIDPVALIDASHKN